jgi:hypothetical protein
VQLTGIGVDLARAWISPDAGLDPVGGRLGGTLELRYAEASGLVAGRRLRLEQLAVAREGQEPVFLRDRRVDVTLRDVTLRDGQVALGRLQIAGSPAVTDARVAPPQRVELSRLNLDVQGELRDFSVPRTNPYLQRFLNWIARRGELTTRVHYRIVGDELTAANELVVQRLAVERASVEDPPDRLVGLPLGLVVALLTDARGEIRVNVPITGRLRSPEFSFGHAFRTALGNVLERPVTAPFRAIGSVIRRRGTVDELQVAPEGRIDDVPQACCAARGAHAAAPAIPGGSARLAGPQVASLAGAQAG